MHPSPHLSLDTSVSGRVCFCVFDAINWLPMHWHLVCELCVTQTKKQRERNSVAFIIRDVRSCQVSIDDNISINRSQVQNGHAHKYICWVFPCPVCFIFNTTTAHVKGYWWFAHMQFCSYSFWLHLEKKIFFAPIHQTKRKWNQCVGNVIQFKIWVYWLLA